MSDQPSTATRPAIDLEQDREDAELDAREALLGCAAGQGASVHVLRSTITTGPS